MTKRLMAFPFIVCATWVLIGCGNKGELFLPPDPLLARQMDAASERINALDTKPLEKDVTDKLKQPANAPLQ